MGKNVWIGAYVYIDDAASRRRCPLATTARSACGRSILDAHVLGPAQADSNGKVVIENDVFIGPHCVILPNVGSAKARSSRPEPS